VVKHGILYTAVAEKVNVWVSCAEDLKEMDESSSFSKIVSYTTPWGGASSIICCNVYYSGPVVSRTINPLFSNFPMKAFKPSPTGAALSEELVVSDAESCPTG